MRKSFLITLSTMLLLSMGAMAKDYPYKTVEGDPLKTRIYTLDNGLKVYMSVNKEKPRLQANVVVKTGSRNDPAETTGLAHYLEHLMFKGTRIFGTTDAESEKPYLDDIKARYENYRKLTDPEERKQAYHEIDSVSQLAAKYNIPNEYDKLMSSLGSEGTNAYTSNDVTCYVENIPSNELENWARIQGDRFQNMVIRGFHTELEAVYEEKNISMASDGRKAYAAMFKLLLPTHPYGTQTTIGEQEHLKNPSIINIEEYFHRYYVPNNMAVTLAGDFDPDQAIAIIDKYFGGYQKSPTLSRPEYEPQPDLTAVKDTTVWGKNAESLMLAWKFKGAADYQNDTLNVISDIMANGKAGLIEVNLEQPMKIQGAGCFYYGLHDYSSLVINGMPNSGQSLEELRDLLVGEIEKLGRGEFSDELLPSVIANMKLRFYRSLDDNRNRAEMMVDAFINDQKWSDVALQLDRQAKLTKQDIIDFARKHLRADNFVCVYKRMGEDTTLVKVEKPAITPIPANREYESDFLREIRNTEVTPIQPQFLDFKKDLTISTVCKQLPLYYKQNTDDDLFTLVFRYEFGTEDDALYPFAATYLSYIGTENRSLQEVQQAFYRLACDYNVMVGSKTLQIRLSGLNENLPAAINLLEEVLNKSKADKEKWMQCVDLIEKNRQDIKTQQGSCFQALWNYGMYGPRNPYREVYSTKELRAIAPEELTEKIANLASMAHSVLYYGPYDEQQLATLLKKEHKIAKKLAAVPEGEPYVEKETPNDEILIAPYDAKNIYLRQYHNEGLTWDPSHTPIISMFNEYFGGGMNTIVFQELRETRGLAYNASALYRRPAYEGEAESFYTHIISQTDKMMDCIHTFAQIVDTIPQNENSFELAKQSLTKSIQSQRTTKFAVINAYLNAKNKGLDYDERQTIYEALPNITLQDVVKFANENVARKPYRYVILGDEKNLDMPALEKIAPVKRLTLEDIFGY